MTSQNLETCLTLLHSRFQMARTLCHEVGPALQNAVFANHGRPSEVFYQDHQLAEGGYELEAQLVGGIFTEFGGHNGLTNSLSYAHACITGKHSASGLAYNIQKLRKEEWAFVEIWY